MAAARLKKCFLISPVNVMLHQYNHRSFSQMSRRVWALVLRNIYLLMGSWTRIVELLYWPTLNILVWGFLNFYLNRHVSSESIVAGVILGGAMLWEILIRSQFSIMMPFLEEMWARNLVQLFVSPLSPIEYAFGMILLSLLRTFIALVPCFLVAFFVFDLWLPGMGWPFIAFYFNLAMTGWWGGFLLVALLFRFGLSAEWLAWMASFLMSPLVAVYYPVSILPLWMQKISWALPPTYVFEGMRAIFNNQVIRYDYMLISFGLNLVYLIFGVFVYLKAFEATRRNEGLMHIAAD
jgi:ABC-2 type transport system permease protein